MRSDDDAYTTTRTSLQRVAEHVLTAALHAATGRIGLRVLPGGFGTPTFPSPHGSRRLRVDGITFVVEDDRGERRAPLMTVRSAAELAEVAPGAPSDVYRPATALDLDRPLAVDAAAAGRLAAWFALTDAALEQLRAECKDEDPSVVQLWPEHFDLATTIAAVNYGGSPGDDGHDRPYLYVGPFQPPPPDGGFWNEPFGASLSEDQVATVHDALAHFRAGRDRLALMGSGHDG